MSQATQGLRPATADERRSLLDEIDGFASPVAVSGLRDGQLGLSWYLASERRTPAPSSRTPGSVGSLVVVDRNLITGRNATEATVGALSAARSCA